jgi:hypothetical protein
VLVVGIAVLVVLFAANSFVTDLSEIPAALTFRFGKPVDVAVRWMNINLAFITDPLR